MNENKTAINEMLLEYSRNNPALNVDVGGILTFSHENKQRKFSGFVGGMIDHNARYHYVAIHNTPTGWQMDSMSMRGKMGASVSLSKLTLTKKQQQNQEIQKQLTANTIQEIEEDLEITKEQREEEQAKHRGILTKTLQTMVSKLPKLKGYHLDNEISLWLRTTQNGYMLAGNIQLEVSETMTRAILELERSGDSSSLTHEPSASLEDESVREACNQQANDMIGNSAEMATGMDIGAMEALAEELRNRPD